MMIKFVEILQIQFGKHPMSGVFVDKNKPFKKPLSILRAVFVILKLNYSFEATINVVSASLVE